MDDKNYHLTLLAKNETGWRNLVKLISRANVDGFYYRPRIDKELLAQHNEGIICLSGCMSGEVARLILDEQASTRPASVIAWHRDLFGKERYFLEIQDQAHRRAEGAERAARRAGSGRWTCASWRRTTPTTSSRTTTAPTTSCCASRPARRSTQTNRMRLGSAEFYLRSGGRDGPRLPRAGRGPAQHPGGGRAGRPEAGLRPRAAAPLRAPGRAHPGEPPARSCARRGCARRYGDDHRPRTASAWTTSSRSSSAPATRCTS